VTDLQDFSRRLFAAADQLWTNSALRPDQYGQPVLALIALRQMESKFEAVHAELAPLYKGRLKPKPSDYQARGAIFLPDTARFSRLLSLPGTANLGAELNAAMKRISPMPIQTSRARSRRATRASRTMCSRNCCACWPR
jgi:type I restriction enzyme M protein